MNIGVDIRLLSSPLRTGVGEYTFGLLNAIFSADKTNHYYLCSFSAQIPWNQPNVHYRRVATPRKLFNIAQLLSPFSRLDKLFSISLDYWFSPNFNFTRLPSSLPHILTAHDLSFEFLPQFYTAKQRLWHKITRPKKQCRQAKIIITPSANTKRDLINLYQIQPDKIRVIYPGVAEEFTRSNPNVSPAAIQTLRQKYFLPDNFILFLGTLEPRKNIIGLIEAFEQACSLLPTPYSLIIAGASGWKNRAVYKRAQNSPYAQYIKFIGYISPTEKPTLYAASSLFIYPSFYEGFGLPILEAMGLGVPVIAANRSSLPEVASSAAYLINPHRSDEIAAGIIRLLTNQSLREKIIANQTAQARRFSWEQSARRWLSLL